MKSIVIDRLVIDNDNDLSLITNPTSIKYLVNEHFQKCPGVINRDKSIPDEWIHQYTPKDHIDENIYNELMPEPTWEEWLDAIRSLPFRYFQRNVTTYRRHTTNSHLENGLRLPTTQYDT